ncbi:MAG: aminopeptidase [Myxococcota bacterium]
MKWTVWRLLPAVLAAGAVLSLIPGCSVGYLATQGYYQGKLLSGGIDVEDALAREDVSAATKDQLRLIQEIRRYGEETLGMTPTRNYTRVNLEWREQIFNVSGSRELKFEPFMWWFPIVGSVPYKGYFQKPDAEAEAERLKQQGYEVAVRRVAGYSTLGWFRDPILPSMLDDDLAEISNLILHELAHSTLFIPGKIDFNESFASFVADVASLRFIAFKEGAEGTWRQEAQARQNDAKRVTTFMHTLYTDLDLLYKSDRSDSDKRREKAAILARAAEAYEGLPFESQRYRGRKFPKLNNADLLQYKRYSSAEDQFARVLAGQEDELKRFFEVFRAVGKSGEDPFKALERLSNEASSTSPQERTSTQP